MSSFAADEVILECELAAEAADPYRVRDKMEGNLARRKGCQPLSEPTCGSVFKNPEGASAGRLIEAAGCKGAEVGGARVSDVHGNFIVNRGGASAADVRALMERVRAAVLASAGIELAPEVRLLGFEEDFPAAARGAGDVSADASADADVDGVRIGERGRAVPSEANAVFAGGVDGTLAGERGRVSDGEDRVAFAGEEHGEDGRRG